MAGHAALTETCGEWANACQIQERFMQGLRATIDGLDYEARCRQVHAVGGDFYDFLPLGDDRLVVAVGDACGKGLAGALMVSNVQSSVRTALLFAADDLQATLDAVNRQVYDSSLDERYATLFYCIFDKRRRTIRYVNAGHPPPMLIRRDGSISFLEIGGAPVGMFPSWSYQVGVVELKDGDVILASTDGVVEAANPEGEEWGSEGLERAFFERNPRRAGETVDAIFAALDEYSGGVQADDATVVALHVG